VLENMRAARSGVGIGIWRRKATGEITKEIASVQSSTGDAVNAIRAITRCMEDINAHTPEVADAITRQELATGEISHNVASAAAQSKAAAAAFGDVAGEFAWRGGVADGTVTLDARIWANRSLWLKVLRCG
jgi:hypothetical protein